MGWFVLCFFLYAFIIIAEEALVRLAPHELELLLLGTSAAEKRAANLARRMRPTLAALLLARIFLKITITVFLIAWLLQAGMVHELLNERAAQFGLSNDLFRVLAGLGWALVLGFIFWLLHRLRFQVLVRQHAAMWLKRLSGFILIWVWIFRLFLRKESPPEQTLDERVENSNAVETPNQMGEKRELELLKSIVQFGDTTVKQVMQPRSKVVGVEFRTNYEQLLQIVKAAEFSRIPVYDEDLDNVTGILYVKDLIAHLDKPASFEWQALIRTNLLIAPESKGCSELLQEFKLEKIHMAIVVDEYGGCSGIVTMEDLLEEVTGDIRDEFDVENDVRYRKIDAHNYLFEGQTLLNDVCRIAGLSPGAFDEVRNTADTLAGLALTLKGDIPSAGTEIVWEQYQLTIIAANNRRIEQLKLTIP
ncbi:MAG: transporter associated domain-containing protein [Saprospiraceae bacterium]|nr:transporter associated domain-containing protein [Saprospiraceae bacterium]